MKVFFIAQHVSNAVTFILRSRGLYEGVLFCFGVYWCIGAVLMSLYESFFIAQHVSNAVTFILRSRGLYVGVLLCLGVYWCIGAVRLE